MILILILILTLLNNNNNNSNDDNNNQGDKREGEHLLHALDAHACKPNSMYENRPKPNPDTKPAPEFPARCQQTLVACLAFVCHAPDIPELVLRTELALGDYLFFLPRVRGISNAVGAVSSESYTIGSLGAPLFGT